jgi:WD40 repeat protein
MKFERTVSESSFVCRYAFASGSPDNIKQWKFPDGAFLQNLSGHNAIINSLAVNADGVLVSAGKCFAEKNIFCE